MNWEFFVSLRYLAAKRREAFISLISLISIIGVAVGVAALIVVISVMSGFDNDLKDKIIGINSHIVVESDYGMADFKAVAARVREIGHVVASSAFVHGQVMARKGDNATGIILPVLKIQISLPGWTIIDLPILKSGMPSRQKPMQNFKPVEAGKKEVGRNSLCPCGSGKKYKRCHGV